MKNTPLKTLLLITLLVLSSCTKGGGNDGSDSGSGSGDGGSGSGGAYSSSCGTVSQGLENPADPAEGQVVTVKQVIASNLLLISTSSGDALLKLFALEPSQPGREVSARSFLTSITSGPLVLFQPNGGCTTPTSQGTAITGQLFNAAGESIEEKYIRSGFAGDPGIGSCSEAAVASCYAALKESSAVESAGDIFDFLWKPVSDSSGNLVVLVAQCDVDIKVNGTSLTDSGGANGRCTTGRGAQPGCGYGSNVKVEVIDRASNLPYLFDGEPFITIPNGCNRVEFVR